MKTFSAFAKEIGLNSVTITRYAEHGLLEKGVDYTKEFRLHTYKWLITPEGEKKMKELTKKRKGKNFYNNLGDMATHRVGSRRMI